MFIKLLDISLSAMYDDFEKASKYIAEINKKNLALIPAIGFIFLYAQIFGEFYIPWWVGVFIGLLNGILFGWIVMWVYARVMYGLCWLLKINIDFDFLLRIFYSSFGALLFFSLTGLIFYLGNLYLRLSWYSGSAFLIMGILWSGYSFTKFLKNNTKNLKRIIVLGLIFLIILLFSVAYFIPLINRQIAMIIQNIEFLKNSILINY